jgi:hypothetical protein
MGLRHYESMSQGTQNRAIAQPADKTINGVFTRTRDYHDW